LSINYQSAVLLVSNIQAARAFYEGLLDLQVGLDLGANVGYETGLALWERKHAESIIHGEARPETQPQNPTRPAFELYWEAKDVQTLWNRLSDAGVEAVHGVREQPWGQLVCRVYDPDHNIVEFGEPMEADLTDAGASLVFQSSVLFVEDMQAARAFYEGLLQQEIAQDLGVNVSYKAGFSLWERAHAESIIFAPTPPGGQAIPDPGPGGADLELYFETDDVPGIWGALAGAGVQAVHEVREQPWGQRVCRVYDPDHNIVEFGEPMDVVIVRFLNMGMTVEETAARTYMPIDIVSQIAAASSGTEPA
jgi:catechol 2,3-dioxygenase-like lactoylglutathione lyase family enzyme